MASFFTNCPLPKSDCGLDGNEESFLQDCKLPRHKITMQIHKPFLRVNSFFINRSGLCHNSNHKIYHFIKNFILERKMQSTYY